MSRTKPQGEEGLPILSLQPEDDPAAALRASLSTASFWWPHQLGPQPAWLEHAPFAFWLIEELRPRVIVELGTHGGYSYFSFCQAVQQLRLDTRCYAIDTWKGDEHAGFYGEEVYEQVRARSDQLYAGFSTLIRSTFDEALPYFADGTIDLFHIDGRHRYADVRHDFEAWIPKLSDRSVVLFHDTEVRQRDFGVWSLWEELSARQPNFEFVHGYGLGVLGFGAHLPESVRNLFAAADRTAVTQIRDAYSRLGSSISLQFRAEMQQRAAATAAQTLAERLAAALHARTAELASALDRVASGEALLEGARQRGAQVEQRNAKLEQQLAMRSQDVEALRADLTAAVAAMRASTSWRVTAPLRWAKLLVGRSYLARYPDVAATGMNPLGHFISFGMAEGPASVPSGTSGRAEHGGDGTGSGAALPAFAKDTGRRDAWMSRGARRILKIVSRYVPLWRQLRTAWRKNRDVKLILSSPLFDPAWYRRRNPGVPESTRVLATHYLLHGGTEGRDPSPLFDSDWYLQQNPDVCGVNPLVHYLRHGCTEGRDPRRLVSHPVAAAAAKCADDEFWASFGPPTGGDRIRTIAVSHNLNQEGAPNSQLELVAGLHSRGVLEPILFSPYDGPLRSSYAAARIPVHIISPPAMSSVAEFGETADAMAAAFRMSGAEVVYANTLQAFWAVAVAERAGLPAIWNVRESEPWQSYYDYLMPEIRPIAYRGFAYADHVVFVADATRRVWEPLNSKGNFITIRNGLNTKRLRQQLGSRDRRSIRAHLHLSESEIVTVLLGTVCDRKGQLDLVRAFKLLPIELAARLQLLIVGDRAGAYSRQLHQEVQSISRDRAARITIFPETREPYAYLQAADIAVCCSRIESYPRVTLEAMAFDLPLITTPVFGIAEQVQNGVNALFYEPGDVAQLAKHLSSLIRDSGFRAKLAANSRRVLGELPDHDAMLDAYSRLFRETGLRGERSFAVPVAAVT